MTIDYLQNINRFTLLGAYPFPNIKEFTFEILECTVSVPLNLRVSIKQIQLKKRTNYILPLIAQVVQYLLILVHPI